MEEQDKEQDEKYEEYTLYQVSNGSSKPLMVLVQINGEGLEMELDTGASVLLVSEETFGKLNHSGISLLNARVKLFTYTGEEIRVKGLVVVSVEHNSHKVNLPLIVTRGSGPSLLGQNWLMALRLDWQSIFVNKVVTLDDIWDQYTDVFKDELGLLKGSTAKIYKEADATPCFFDARSVRQVQRSVPRLPTKVNKARHAPGGGAC